MRNNDFEMMESIKIPSRSQLKSDELCYFSDMIFKSKDGFVNAIIKAYMLGFYRGIKRERIDSKKKRSARYVREKHEKGEQLTR